MTGALFERPPRAQKRLKFKNFCAHHQANDQTSVLSTERVQKSHLGTKLWAFEKKLWQKVFFLGYPVTTSNFDEIKKFQKPARSQEPEDYSGLWNFWKISFLAWVMDNTVWSQIVALLGKFYTTPYFFLFSLPLCTFFAISYQHPSKIP